jgi:SAM-dependent methyltransferase
MDFWTRGRLAIAKALNLDLTHAQVHYSRILSSCVTSGTKWLEIGCGRQIIPDWAMPLEEQRQIVLRSSLLVGLDTDQAILQHPLIEHKVIGLGGTLPFAPETFDLITANMVMEHVEMPEEFLRDIWRVLRCGGRFLFHTPNYISYDTFIASLLPQVIKNRAIRALEGREEQDVFPTYYRLNTARRVRRLAPACGFTIEKLNEVSSGGAFFRFGPIGWLECPVLKLREAAWGGKFNPNLIVVLRKEDRRA